MKLSSEKKKELALRQLTDLAREDYLYCLFQPSESTGKAFFTDEQIDNLASDYYEGKDLSDKEIEEL